jgi:hypothetical protein
MANLKLSEMLEAQAKFVKPQISKNWIVRYYDKKDSLIGSHTIKDRTEHEAENEAVADMPYECEDWTLVEKK